MHIVAIKSDMIICMSFITNQYIYQIYPLKNSFNCNKINIKCTTS